MDFFSKLICSKIVNNNLKLTLREKDLLSELADLGIIEINGDEIYLEKEVSLITSRKFFSGVNLIEVKNLDGKYLYIFSYEKIFPLTKFNYTKDNKYESLLDSINANLFKENKFAILKSNYISIKPESKVEVIKKVLTYNGKNFLIDYELDQDKLFNQKTLN